MSVFDKDISLDRIPESVAAEARKAGFENDACLFAVRADLDLDQEKCESWLVVAQWGMAAFALYRDGSTRLLKGPFRFGDILKVRTFQTVGSAFFQVMVDDSYVDTIRYSNAHREIFERSLKQIERIVEGKPFQSEALLRPSDVVCNQCGLPLPSRKANCPRCRATRGLFFRTVGLMKAYYGYVFVLLMLSVVAVALELVPPLINQVLFDEVLAPTDAEQFPVSQFLFGSVPDGRNTRLLLWIVMTLLGAYALQQSLAMIVGRLSAWIGTRITYDMRERLQRKLMGISVDYHDQHSSGSLMSRVLYDVEYFQSFVEQVAQGFLVSLLRVLGIGTAMFIMNWKLALYVLIPIPLAGIFTTVFWHFLYARHYRFRDSRSKINQLLSGLYSGVRLVKAFAQEGREMKRFDAASVYLRDSGRGLMMSLATFNPIVQFLFALGGLMIWYAGGHKVLDGDMTIGTLAAFITFVFMFYAPVSALSAFSNWVSGFVTAGQRVFEVLDATSAVDTAENPEPIGEMVGRIELKNVTFGYDPYAPVLNDVSLEIEPGEFIGIVGKSGSGKTTLVNLICRFYDPQEGTVEVDGRDIRGMAKEDLHRNIGLVLQEPFLFRASISDNISYGRPDSTPLEIQDAARSANAHTFISRMPAGYDTRLGERGAGLSGGERQRVSIARALLCDPRILILDEATSSVDTESEQEIQRALVKLSKGRTTIAIAHRLATLKNSDRIYVIDEGRIAEQGSHEELMDLGGIYHRLVKIQTELTKLEVD